MSASDRTISPSWEVEKPESTSPGRFQKPATGLRWLSGALSGSCPNVACLPSKNIIHSAKVASLARRGTEFGLDIRSMSTNMAGVRGRKRSMVDALIKVHLDRYEASGVELIMGQGRFVAPKTVTISLNTGGEQVITADRVVLSLGTRSAYPDLPGLVEASPMTHVQALNLIGSQVSLSSSAAAISA